MNVFHGLAIILLIVLPGAVFADETSVAAALRGRGVELNEEVALANPYTGAMLHLEMTQHPVS